MRSITSLLDFVRVTSLLVVNVLGHVLQLSRKLVVLWVLKLTFTFLTFLWYLCHAAVDSDPVSTHTGAMTEVAVKGPDVNETAAEWSTENAASDPAPPSDPVLTSAAAGTEVDVEGTDVSETAAMWSAAGVGHVFTFRVAFLLLRIKFMHCGGKVYGTYSDGFTQSSTDRGRKRKGRVGKGWGKRKGKGGGKGRDGIEGKGWEGRFRGEKGKG